MEEIKTMRMKPIQRNTGCQEMSVPGTLPNKPPVAGAGAAPNAGAGVGCPNAGAVPDNARVRMRKSLRNGCERISNEHTRSRGSKK
jgi:hypothetical protein